MTVIHAHLDERLCHGQITSNWVGSVGARIILAISEEVKNDPMMYKIYSKMGALSLPGYNVMFVSPEEAAEKLNSGELDNEKVFVLLRRPKDLHDLVKKYPNIKYATIGNRSGRHRLVNPGPDNPGIGYRDEDVPYFKELHKMGVEIVAQTLPGGKKTKFMDKMANI